MATDINKSIIFRNFPQVTGMWRRWEGVRATVVKSGRPYSDLLASRPFIEHAVEVTIKLGM